MTARVTPRVTSRVILRVTPFPLLFGYLFGYLNLHWVILGLSWFLDMVSIREYYGLLLVIRLDLIVNGLY